MNKYYVRVIGDAQGGVRIEADGHAVEDNCIRFYKTNKDGQAYTAYIYPAHLTIVKRLID